MTQRVCGYAATFLCVPLGLIQIILILAGRNFYHRWLGRTILQLWTWVSVLALVIDYDETGMYR